METEKGKIADALLSVLISPNEEDRNWEPANVVDGLFAIARALDRIGKRLEGDVKVRE
jgi:hypothetical protein